MASLTIGLANTPRPPRCAHPAIMRFRQSAARRGWECRPTVCVMSCKRSGLFAGEQGDDQRVGGGLEKK